MSTEDSDGSAHATHGSTDAHVCDTEDTERAVSPSKRRMKTRRVTASRQHEEELLRREFKLIKNLFSRTITNDLIDRSEMKRALSMSDKELGIASSLPTLQSDAVNWSTMGGGASGEVVPNLTTLDPEYTEEKQLANSKLDDYILQQIGRYQKYFSDGLKRKFDCWRVAALEKDRLLIAILKREESRVTSLAQSIAQCKIMEHNHRYVVENLLEVAEKKQLTIAQFRHLYKRCISIMEEGDLYKKIYKKPEAAAPRIGNSTSIIVNRPPEDQQSLHQKQQSEKFLRGDDTSLRQTPYLDSFSPNHMIEDGPDHHEYVAESPVEDDSQPDEDKDDSYSTYNFTPYDPQRKSRGEILAKYYEDGAQIADSQQIEHHLTLHAENLRDLTESYLREFDHTEKMCFAHIEMILEESNEKVFNFLTINDQDQECQVNIEPESQLSSTDEVEAHELFQKEYTDHEKELKDIQKLLNNEHSPSHDVDITFDSKTPSQSMDDDELDIDRELNRLMELQERRESDSLNTDSNGLKDGRLSLPTLSRSYSVQSALSELTDLTDWDPHELELETEFQQREKRQEQVDKLQLERQRILNEELTATNDRLMHEVEEYRRIAERSEDARKMLQKELHDIKNTKPIDQNRVKRLSQKLEAINGEEKQLSSSYQRKTEALRQQIEQVQKEKEELQRQIKVRQYRRRVYDSLTRLDSHRHLNLPTEGSNAPNIPRGVVGLIFTDIVQSTALWSSIPNVMEQCIYLHYDTIRNVIRQFKGAILDVKHDGDSLFAVTSDCRAGVDFMMRLQLAMLNAPWPEELLQHPHGREIKDEDGTIIFRGLKIRMGMHFGRAIMHVDKTTKRPDYYGSSVSMAARAETVAEPGCCAVTPQVWDQIRDHLDKFPIPMAVKHVGKIALKGIPQPQLIRLLAPQQLQARVEQTSKKEVDLLIENKLFDLFSERNRLIKKTTDLQILLKKRSQQMVKMRTQIQSEKEEKVSMKEQLKQLEEKNALMRQEYEVIVQKVEKLQHEQRQIIRQQQTAKESVSNFPGLVPIVEVDGESGTEGTSPPGADVASISNSSTKGEKIKQVAPEATAALLAEAHTALREFNKSKTGWRMTLTKSFEAKKMHHLLPVGTATRVKPKVSQSDLEELLKKSVKQMELLQKQIALTQKERDTYKSSWSSLQRQMARSAEESKFELMDLQKSIASSLNRSATNGSGPLLASTTLGPTETIKDTKHHSYDPASILSMKTSLDLLEQDFKTPKKGVHRSSLGNIRAVHLTPLDKGHSPQVNGSPAPNGANSRTSDTSASPHTGTSNGVASNNTSNTIAATAGGNTSAKLRVTRNSYEFSSLRKLPKLRS